MERGEHSEETNNRRKDPLLPDDKHIEIPDDYEDEENNDGKNFGFEDTCSDLSKKERKYFNVIKQLHLLAESKNGYFEVYGPGGIKFIDDDQFQLFKSLYKTSDKGGMIDRKTYPDLPITFSTFMKMLSRYNFIQSVKDPLVYENPYFLLGAPNCRLIAEKRNKPSKDKHGSKSRSKSEEKSEDKSGSKSMEKSEKVSGSTAEDAPSSKSSKSCKTIFSRVLKMLTQEAESLVTSHKNAEEKLTLVAALTDGNADMDMHVESIRQELKGGGSSLGRLEDAVALFKDFIQFLPD